jgi:hypothetical protein
MFLFATTALEQFVDKLPQWPQYLSSLITIPALKNNSILFEKVNEINNKSKGKDSIQGDGKNQYQFNNMVNNIINFDFQIEEKRSNKDLSQVSKMPVFPNDEFNRNFKTITNNEKQVPGVHPYMMQPQGFIPRNNYFQQQGNKSIHLKLFLLINTITPYFNYFSLCNPIFHYSISIFQHFNFLIF